jgi:diguanylate cyclase (GGDEF)-like protein
MPGQSNVTRDRVVLGAAAITLTALLLTLRIGDGPWDAIAHAAMGLLLAGSLVRTPLRQPSRTLIVIATIVWAIAQALRLVPLPVAWLEGVATTLGILGGLALVQITDGRTRRVHSTLIGDAIVLALALGAIAWFGLTGIVDGADVRAMGLILAAALAPAIPLAALMQHPQARFSMTGIALGSITLVGSALAGDSSRTDAGWDLVASAGFLVIIAAIRSMPATIMSELGQRVDRDPTAWPSPVRTIPTVLVAISLGMALAHALQSQWHVADALIAIVMTALLVLRQAQTLVEERSLLEMVREQRREITHQALHDPLTSLPNRDLFYNRLEHALTLRQRSAAPLSVVYIDIDDFASVNERHGHGTGDALLVALAMRLSMWVRPADTVARLGGDEFAVLVDGSEDAAMVVVARLTEEIAKGFELSGRTIMITVNIGVAAAGDVAGDVVLAATRLVNRADQARLAAKPESRD